MGNREIKVGLIQMRTMPGTTVKEKVDHSLPLIEKASKEGCKIILHGELATVDYTMFFRKDRENYKFAEPVPGPTTDAVGELTKKYQNYVIMPLFERTAPGIHHNAAPIVGPDGKVFGDYYKVHLAAGTVAEPLYFRAGREFKVWETEFEPCAKFSTLICYDRRSPEAARIVATLGAEILFYPHAAMTTSEPNWDTICMARSIDTGLFTCYANRSGLERWGEVEKSYFGRSQIVNPFGEIIAKAGGEQDVVVSAVLDLDEVERARIAMPIVRDMRNEIYARYYSSLPYDRLL